MGKMGDMNNLGFRWHFLLPKFWGEWGWLGVLWVISHLPRAWVMGLGRVLGDLVRLTNHKRRHIATVNLGMAFPKLSPRRRHALLVGHFRQSMRGLLDSGVMLWGNATKFERICEFPKQAQLRQLAAQSPLIVVAYHHAGLDICGKMITRTAPSVSMMHRARSELVTWQLWRGRRNLTDVKLVLREQGLRPLVRFIKNKHICFLVPDEDFGVSKNTVFAEFFGVTTSTLTVVSRLVALTGARVVGCNARLNPRSGKYAIHLSPPIDAIRGKNPATETARLNAVMESLLRDAPEQYMWTFRCFMTRPDGSSNPYTAPPEPHRNQ